MAIVDVTSKIERLEMFEEQAGVVLESLSAFIQQTGGGISIVQVRGDLQLRTGTRLQENVTLELTVHDPDNRIVGLGHSRFEQEKFFGFQPFEFGIIIPMSNISKIRLYPRRG